MTEREEMRTDMRRGGDGEREGVAARGSKKER